MVTALSESGLVWLPGRRKAGRRKRGAESVQLGVVIRQERRVLEESNPPPPLPLLPAVGCSISPNIFHCHSRAAEWGQSVVWANSAEPGSHRTPPA